VANGRYVNAINERHADEREKAEQSDSGFDHGVYEKRMVARGGADARKREASQAQTAHECCEKNSQGDGRRADDELKHLVPDNFVDECGAPAARKEEKQQREPAR
jgi:hypothetical protein